MGRAEASQVEDCAASVAPGGPQIEIEVVYCAARGQVDATRLSLAAGATVAEAVLASGVLDRHPGLGMDDLGVWGRISAGTRVLRAGDRVEIYRPLQVAPMEARRSRQREQGRGRGSGRPSAGAGRA